MSMHWYPFGGYGLYLDKDEADAFVQAYSNLYFDGGADEADVMSNLDGQILDANESIDGWSVRALDGHDGLGDAYAEGIFLYGPRKGSCLTSDAANLYRDAKEMAGELFAMYGDCLPKDFDYPRHLAEIQGAIAG